MLEGEHADQASAVLDGNRPAIRAAQRCHSFLQHVMRVHGWNIASHGVAHRDVRALLGQRPQEVFPRQDAQNVVAEYDGKVLLPARQDVVDGAREAVIRGQRAKVRQHDALHRDAA